MWCRFNLLSQLIWFLETLSPGAQLAGTRDHWPLELETKVHEVFTITEKGPTRDLMISASAIQFQAVVAAFNKEKSLEVVDTISLLLKYQGTYHQFLY